MKKSPAAPSVPGNRRFGVQACTYRVLPFLVTAALLTGCTAVAGTAESTGSTSASATAAVAVDTSTTAAEVLAANQQTHDGAADY